MMFFFKADAAMMANVDFPDPRSPTRAREASELKSGILALLGVSDGVGVREMFSDSDDELVNIQGLNRRSTASDPSAGSNSMAASGLLTPAMMPHSVSVLEYSLSWTVRHEDGVY